MSTKKPAFSSKLNPSRPFATPPRRWNSNSSLYGSNPSLNKIPGVSRGLNLNATSCGPSLQNTTLVPQGPDMEMQCEFAYNEYLQEVMRSLLLDKAIAAHSTSCNDQLEAYREIKNDLQNQENALKHQIEDIEIRAKLAADYNKIRKLVEEHLKLFNTEQDKRIVVFNDILERTTNQLYLSNVQPLQNQQEYDKFEKLLEQTKVLLERFIKIAGDIQGTKKLAGCMDNKAKLLEQLTHRNEIVKNLSQNLASITLEKASDLLAVI